MIVTAILIMAVFPSFYIYKRNSITSYKILTDIVSPQHIIKNRVHGFYAMTVETSIITINVFMNTNIQSDKIFVTINKGRIRQKKLKWEECLMLETNFHSYYYIVESLKDGNTLGIRESLRYHEEQPLEKKWTLPQFMSWILYSQQGIVYEAKKQRICTLSIPDKTRSLASEKTFEN